MLNLSTTITAENLEEVVEINLKIKDQIKDLVADFFKDYSVRGITRDKLVFKILKEKNLIQIPIPDLHWGGAIIVKDNLCLPIINTAQPRVYQYFVAWHEIYHLLYDVENIMQNHEISVDLELGERRADYFAASILLGNVYEQYFELNPLPFIDRIFICMDMFKSPYKAVLIHLYEEAKIKYNNTKLQEEIKEYFDKKFNLAQEFRRLGLDDSLVQPSYHISFSNLEIRIDEAIQDNPDVTYHAQNKQHLENIKNLIEQIKDNKTNE